MLFLRNDRETGLNTVYKQNTSIKICVSEQQNTHVCDCQVMGLQVIVMDFLLGCIFSFSTIPSQFPFHTC